MAASMEGFLSENLREKVNSSRILMVGAGGIGCELLKNLVLTGFNQIEVIDLDTIDVSNLNRQFLFRKEHVGKSKAQVAKEGALLFNPLVDITAYHDSIMSTDYGVEFFKKFNVILNALDNRAARNHVNRMCLAANVPLIESGTAGYLGQVNIIKKGLTECYECFPKPAQKSYPGCTIRNTPSEPIHCIVWAKHLFNQLYGEADADQDVSPDTQDPEAVGDAAQGALSSTAEVSRKSTRIWAEDTGYDAQRLFNKFFREDIRYLLSMENLWKKRRPPTPLDFTEISETVVDAVSVSKSDGLICDQRIWSMKDCLDMFVTSVGHLKEELLGGNSGAMLVWDKDSEAAMNFVASASNIRSFIFGIPVKSKFEIKSMAGNIIPAIATTNAIIGGVIVMETIKVLTGQWDACRSVYLNRQPNDRRKLLIPVALDAPNPKCYVCSSKPEVTVHLNINSFTIKCLEDKVLKSCLGMVAPDVEIDDGKGTILISSEEGETDDNWPKCLSEFDIQSGARLKCDDFLQEFNLIVHIVHKEKLANDVEFELVGDVSAVQAESLKAGDAVPDAASNGLAPSTSKEKDDDDLVLMDDDDEDEEGERAAEDKTKDIIDKSRGTSKRKAAGSTDDEDENVPSKKKICIDSGSGDTGAAADCDDEDVLMID